MSCILRLSKEHMRKERATYWKRHVQGISSVGDTKREQYFWNRSVCVCERVLS